MHLLLVVSLERLELEAPGAEPAPRRRVRRARQVALEQDPLAGALAARVGQRDRRQQRLRVRVRRAARTARACRDLDDLAEVHHRDAVGDVPHHRQVVRDEHVAQAELVAQVVEQVDDAGLDRHVQRRHRLVQDEQARVQRERAGDADALPLAAGELVRVARGVLGVEPDQCHQLAHARRAARRRDATLWMTSGSAMSRLHLHARVERGVRVLEDELDVAAQRAHLAARQPDQLAPSNTTLPHVAGCRLSTARPVVDLPQPDSPTRPSASPRIDLERDAVDGLDVADGAPEQPAADREVLRSGR